MAKKNVSDRIRVKRENQLAHYDSETLYEVLDSHIMAHIGYVIDGQPFVTPTLYWREGNKLYWHGSAASRMVREQIKGIPVCVTISHLDGIVFARSGYNTTVNYRSAMVYGKAELLDDTQEVERQFELFFERLSEGRWASFRPSTPQELKATSMLVMEIEEASVKIRTGPPEDEDEDMDAPIWGGVLPVKTVFGEPEADDYLRDDAAPLGKPPKKFIR